MARVNLMTQALKDPKTLLTVGAVFLGFLALWGSDKWYSKDAGLATERRVTSIEHKMDTQHQLQVIKHDHTVEKVGELHEDFTELKELIKQRFPHSGTNR